MLPQSSPSLAQRFRAIRFGHKYFGVALLVCLSGTTTHVMAQQPAWKNTGSLHTARSQHTATLLGDGKVLVAGGSDGIQNTASAELYDPATGTWNSTGSLSSGRAAHIAVRLGNGKVLVAGGVGSPGLTLLTSAELYDSATGTWSGTGSLGVGRRAGAAVLLADGRVLFAGGFPSTSGQSTPENQTAEIYDPATGLWNPTTTLNAPHALATLTRLPDGKVLIAGGSKSNKAEIYDPATNIWTLTSDLITARQQHSAVYLPNGKVLVVCGGTVFGLALFAQAELYDPATGAWSATGDMTSIRLHPALTLLANGQALAEGGVSTGGSVKRAELYDPASGTWTAPGEPSAARSDDSATLLGDGRVLVAAGSSGNLLSTAELFDSGAVAHISAATLLPGPIAPGSLVTAKSSGGLANTTTVDPSGSRTPGTTLGGTTVTIRDSAGAERLALLDYVSPTQVNYIVPSDVAVGAAKVTIASQGGAASTNLQIQSVAPGIFTLNELGLAAAVAVRLRNGVQSVDQVFQDTPQGRVSLPIDLGPDTDQVVLLLFGTGFRFQNDLSKVRVTIGGIEAPVSYAGLQSDFPGLDQINVTLPRSLAGRGMVNVQVTVDRSDANITRVSIR